MKESETQISQTQQGQSDNCGSGASLCSVDFWRFCLGLGGVFISKEKTMNKSKEKKLRVEIDSERFWERGLDKEGK